MTSAFNLKPQPILSVSQLTYEIKGLLEPRFDNIAVVGEISNFKPHASGHWYFSLKDREATISCACFRQSNIRVKFDPEDGLKVVARGSVEIYAPRGNYQMIITSLEPVGIGQWQLAFEQLKDKLEKEKLLDTSRKRPIPRYPRTIGVVSSPTAAALQDVLTALRRRNKGVRIIISPTRVQGDSAPQEIAQAIADLEKVSEVEVIIVARGGGSIEDLWSFNTEPVARAVATCRVPVISGVGHETDVTICDLVADLRAPTPTAAAELVSLGQVELEERWGNLNTLLFARVQHKLICATQALVRLNPRHALSRQSERLQRVQLQLQTLAERLERARQSVISERQSRLDKLTDQLARISELQISERRHKWHRLEERLQALSPLNVLMRGFAIVRRPDGTLVQTADQVKAGDTVEAWLRKGKLRLKVEECMDSWQSEDL